MPYVSLLDQRGSIPRMTTRIRTSNCADIPFHTACCARVSRPSTHSVWAGSPLGAFTEFDCNNSIKFGH